MIVLKNNLIFIITFMFIAIFDAGESELFTRKKSKNVVINTNTPEPEVEDTQITKLRVIQMSCRDKILNDPVCRAKNLDECQQIAKQLDSTEVELLTGPVRRYIKFLRGDFSEVIDNDKRKILESKQNQTESRKQSLPRSKSATNVDTQDFRDVNKWCNLNEPKTCYELITTSIVCRNGTDLFELWKTATKMTDEEVTTQNILVQDYILYLQTIIEFPKDKDVRKAYLIKNYCELVLSNACNEYLRITGFRTDKKQDWDIKNNFPSLEYNRRFAELLKPQDIDPAAKEYVTGYIKFINEEADENNLYGSTYQFCENIKQHYLVLKNLTSDERNEFRSYGISLYKV